jgi:putative oxidoreductase
MTYATSAYAARPALISGVANADLAATILRVSMGVLFLAHAWLKLVIFTPAGTAGFFESLGFRGFLAYLVIAAELGGGIALILGVWSRWVALALVPILLGTIYAPHGAAPASTAAAAITINLPAISGTAAAPRNARRAWRGSTMSRSSSAIPPISRRS